MLGSIALGDLLMCVYRKYCYFCKIMRIDIYGIYIKQ